ncbi:hypothetical protein ACFO5X_21365 [Seohaeicola nanhaiensis]|uniref:Uncharacterized protein n=1 Tax=Seohaeicola nanhaiensis TaxID=1387282 RepID=A0ABV9KMA1_9RHOB
MPPHTLFIMILCGIAAIAIGIYLQVRSIPVTLTEDSARTAWESHFPEEPARAVTLAASGHFALLETAAGFGLVWAFGRDIGARPLLGAQASNIRQGLHIRFPDIKAPAVRLALSQDERAAWRLRAGI